VTAGQRNDLTAAPALLAATRPQYLLGDRAYAAASVRATLAAWGGVACTPPKRDHTVHGVFDRERYKARSEIECTFGLLKQARRFATRYEKTLRNYAAVVAIGCALLWLRI
jgi:transposase